MSGSVSGGVSDRPGSKPGPPSRTQRESLRSAFVLPQSIGCGGLSSGVPTEVVPGANSRKFQR